MFYFVEDFPQIEENTRTVIISNKIIGKKFLFKRFKDKLLFPDWFGYNYHAFYDLMTQLYYWFPEENVRIYHKSLPVLFPKSMRTYLDYLNLIDVEWEKFTERANITRQDAEKHPDHYIPFEGVRPWWEEKPKIFNVYFRKRDESFVKDILHNYSWDYRKCMQFDETGMIDIKYTDRYPRGE